MPEYVALPIWRGRYTYETISLNKINQTRAVVFAKTITCLRVKYSKTFVENYWLKQYYPINWIFADLASRQKHFSRKLIFQQIFQRIFDCTKIITNNKYAMKLPRLNWLTNLLWKNVVSAVLDNNSAKYFA